MMRLFFDSSALFAGVHSIRGHAHDLLRLASREVITLVVSQYVLEETRRNLAASVPESLVFLDLIVKNIPFELAQPTKRDVLVAARHVALKDAPIVAAARKAKVDFLVTLDKKHLLGRPDLAKYVRAEIVTPKEAVIRLTRIN